uniref:Proteasome subunit beta 11 n=1 Tax=Hucho hucho TaxID=62062 RepID=A0A4W5RVT2_9TELE
MALQDVWGFQDTPMSHRWNTRASLFRPMGDITPLLDMADGKEPWLGTTTLAFVFRGGVIASADTRASCSGLVSCPSAQKILPIHSHLLVTTSGSGADYMLWERILAREIRLYQLRHGRRLSITGSAKLLSHILDPFKGTNVCVAATLSGSDVELFYVCSDGTRLQGELFSVGSGSPYAEAVTLAREIVYRATHRDAYSGNYVDLFHITAQGYSHRDQEDLRENLRKNNMNLTMLSKGQHRNVRDRERVGVDLRKSFVSKEDQKDG